MADVEEWRSKPVENFPELRGELIDADEIGKAVQEHFGEPELLSRVLRACSSTQPCSARATPRDECALQPGGRAKDPVPGRVATGRGADR
jgi:hypothetical protein